MNSEIHLKRNQKKIKMFFPGNRSWKNDSFNTLMGERNYREIYAFKILLRFNKSEQLIGND